MASCVVGEEDQDRYFPCRHQSWPGLPPQLGDQQLQYPAVVMHEHILNTEHLQSVPTLHEEREGETHEWE